MITLEFTTSQNKNNCVLGSTSGLQRRSFPDLEEEIGFDPATLLLQLDYWIGNRGFERDGRRWIKMSAKTISKWAFRTWSQRKVQREIKALHEADLIDVQYFDGPYTTPYIALNITTIAAKLKSVHILDAATQEEEIPAAPPKRETVDQPPARTSKSAPAEKTTDEVRGSSPVLEVITYYTFTSTATMAGIDILDGEIDANDAPSPTSASIPPSTKTTTLKENTASVPVDASEDQTKEIPEKRKESKKRESADRAKRATPSSKGKPQTEVNPHSKPIHAPEWEKFCRKLADICAIDFDIDPGLIRAWASKIWKNGNNGKGYTIDDLDDFIVWWNTYDWRGAANHTVPVPKQVIELIRQSYEHESSETRRNMRAKGFSPDEDQYKYISGPLAEYIHY